MLFDKIKVEYIISHCFTDSLRIADEAMVPSSVLVLGGILAKGPNDSNLGRRTTIGIINCCQGPCIFYNLEEKYVCT